MPQSRAAGSEWSTAGGPSPDSVAQAPTPQGPPAPARPLLRGLLGGLILQRCRRIVLGGGLRGGGGKSRAVVLHAVFRGYRSTTMFEDAGCSRHCCVRGAQGKTAPERWWPSRGGSSLLPPDHGALQAFLRTGGAREATHAVNSRDDRGRARMVRRAGERKRGFAVGWHHQRQSIPYSGVVSNSDAPSGGLPEALRHSDARSTTRLPAWRD